MKKNLKEKPLITLTDIDIGNSVESFAQFLNSQKDLFHSQIDQLQNLVVTQCRLTGVNPLSQEMAAGALSINIGKRPRDLLNPKGVKYMQSVFSIKDTISKKETREISALCGVTATQVREFFAGQRSRVRKFVRLAREKVIKADAAKASQEGCSANPDANMHVFDPIPLNSVDLNVVKSDAEKAVEGGCSSSSDPAMHVMSLTPLNSVEPTQVVETPSSSSKEETVPGADDFEKKFIENIFNLMRKEETFSGQVKLMEWILQIQNSSVLYWFVTKGGLMMLAAWLNEAALEEQTTTLFVIFQVLCHLPLHKALPPQMSAILQTVNRLRFYRTSDISNRAKVLLSRWSKLFVRSQALKRPFSNFAAQKEKNLGLSGVSSNEWQSNLVLPEEILSLALDSSENCRKSEPSPNMKLLQASNDDSNKKHTRNASSTQTKERRKVQLMEQPGRKPNGRSVQGSRAIHSNQGRPMSADDIQKAKLRAMFMQSKNGKTGTASNGSQQQKIENLKKLSTSQISPLSSPSKPPLKSSTSNLSPSPSPSKPPSKLSTYTGPSPSPSKPPSEPSPDLGPSPSSPKPPPVRCLIEEIEKPVILPSETSPALPETPIGSESSLGHKESPWEKLKRDQIPWHLPPEIRMEIDWGVGIGENSKEVEIQTSRIKREKETIYQRISDIPANPKEPWDLEMDYDDTLTPHVPIEQVFEEDTMEQAVETDLTEVPLPPLNVVSASVAPVATPADPIASLAAPITSVAVPNTSTENVPEPDLELLAVLLKNPELVFALTSGQGGNLSSEDTVKLLDMIKNSGGGLPGGVLNGFNGNIQEEPASLPSPTPRSPTSLPSPTPSSDYNGWRPEACKDTFTQPVSATNREAYMYHPATSAPSPNEYIATGLVQHQNQTTNFPPGLAQYQNETTNLVVPQQNQELWVDDFDNFTSGLNHHSIPIDYRLERQVAQMNQMQHSNQTPLTLNPLQQNVLAAVHQKLHPEPASFGQLQLQPETLDYRQMQQVKPAAVSITLNLPEGTTPISFPPWMSTTQSLPLPENYFPQSFQTSTMQWDAPTSNIHNQMSDDRGGRQRRYEHNASGSNPWLQSNQNGGYSCFPEEPMRSSVPDQRSSQDRNDYRDESDFEAYSPRRTPERSRSPEYRLGRSYSERRRDHGRNSRPDFSRRRDYSRHEYKQSSSRRWRDRRY